MIDPMISLAFAVHSRPGVYALLLGSGVSRSAGIPTGWEVTLNLIHKVAALSEENCGEDPEGWFAEKYDQQPDYSRLLEELAKTPTARQELLRAYFEPTDEEREEGRKLPSPAHRAIAGLIAQDKIRVVITTNFDRLLETALKEVGVEPVVISTADQAAGATPLTHAPCTILKVNGDYLDARIRNTPDELASYEPSIEAMLDRIFDEFGLIVCGWSADWDLALRSALERCTSRRYTTYWTQKDALTETAQRLISQEPCEIITIEDADSFFVDLKEKVDALERIARPHPLSKRMAVASLKRCLQDPNRIIEVHELISAETERVCSEIGEDRFPFQRKGTKDELRGQLQERMERYEAITETLCALLATGCYWGDKKHERIWVDCLNRVANLRGEGAGILWWIQMRLYPTVLLLHAGGMAAVAAENYATLRALLCAPIIAASDGNKALLYELILQHSHWEVLAQELPEKNRRRVPLSERLEEVLREPLREYVPDDTMFRQVFDRFCYLLALAYGDIAGETQMGLSEMFIYRNRIGRTPCRVAQETEEELQRLGENWPPFKAGLFQRSLSELKSLKQQCDKAFRERANRPF